MVLNKKQKQFVFEQIFSKRDLVKIFDTTDIDWLVKQKVALKDDNHGWKILYLNGEEYTSLNFANNPGWSEVLDNIEDNDKCEWCEDWFEKEELIQYHKWRLCSRCKAYLQSRGE